MEELADFSQPTAYLTAALLTTLGAGMNSYPLSGQKISPLIETLGLNAKAEGSLQGNNFMAHGHLLGDNFNR